MTRTARIVAGAVALSTCVTANLSAADHREAPLIRQDLSADINDVYAFLNPADASRLVLIMTVNPFSAPAENVTYNFAPNVRYQFFVDSDGDARADSRVVIRFADAEEGGQTFIVRASGGSVASGMVTPPSEEPEPAEPIVATSRDGSLRAFAGQRDDPFYFDVVGFSRFLAGTGSFAGSDGFAGFNVSAIVVELPVDDLLDDASSLQIWGATTRRQITIRRSSDGLLEEVTGPWEQVDRMGVPAINTALIPAGLKDFYNISTPLHDSEGVFAPEIVASLQALGTDDENIGILASVAIPDTLKLDVEAAPGFPNGRLPGDDVVDTLLFFIFNQMPVSDLVDGNDRVFPADFPFLAPPHQPR